MAEKPDKQQREEAKKQRLAAALRANMKRRKTQTRERKSSDDVAKDQ